MSQDTTAFVLLFDADNTLWDTNGVFFRAQTQLLAVIAEAGWLTSPVDEVETLRVLDRYLMTQLGKFEYDFGKLAIGIALLYKFGLPIEEIACILTATTSDKRVEQIRDIAEQAFVGFQSALHEIPQFLPGAEEILLSLSTLKRSGYPIAILLISEGEQKRLETIISHYKIRENDIFDDILLVRKNAEEFAKAWHRGLYYLEDKSVLLGSESKSVAIGDSLKRDIAFAKEAGCRTVYVPAGFMGVETPKSESEQPDFIIENLWELPGVFQKFGLFLPGI